MLFCCSFLECCCLYVGVRLVMQVGISWLQDVYECRDWLCNLEFYVDALMDAQGAGRVYVWGLLWLCWLNSVWFFFELVLVFIICRFHLNEFGGRVRYTQCCCTMLQY